MWDLNRARRPLGVLVAVLTTVAVLEGTGGVLGGRWVPAEVLLVGGVSGSLSGLVAVGLVLVHRAQRVVSFAAAALGAPAAALGAALYGAQGLPWVVGLAACVATAPLAGLLGAAVATRLADSPRAVSTVATIGLAEILAGLELAVIAAAGTAGRLPQLLPSPLTATRWQLGVARVTGDHLLAVVVSAALVGGLAVVIRRSDLGLALRAVADRPGRAAGLGVATRRIVRVAWCAAAVFASLAIFLRLPISGAPPTGGLGGAAVLLPALAAAAVGRFENLPRAFAAAVALGALESSVVFATGRTNATTFALLVVCLAAALSAPRAATRGLEAAGALWSATLDAAPLPARLRNVAAFRALRAAGLGVIAIAAVVVPNRLGVGDVGRLSLVCIFALLAVSVVIASGWTGQLALGSVGTAGIGAVVAAGLATRAQGVWADFFVTLLAASVTGALCAVVVGLPALRRPGVLPGVTSLAFAGAVAAFLRDSSAAWLLPPPGVDVARPILFERFDVSSAWRFLGICATSLALGCVVARTFRRTRPGRLAIATRDNPRLVATVGVDARRPILFALALSGALAGLAGAVLAFQQGTVDPSAFSPDQSVRILALVVAGGASSVVGAVVAAAVLVGLPLLIPGVPAIGPLATGGGLLVVLLVIPGGAAPAMARLQRRLAARLARRAGVDEDEPMGAVADAPVALLTAADVVNLDGDEVAFILQAGTRR